MRASESQGNLFGSGTPDGRAKAPRKRKTKPLLAPVSPQDVEMYLTKGDPDADVDRYLELAVDTPCEPEQTYRYQWPKEMGPPPSTRYTPKGPVRPRSGGCAHRLAHTELAQS